MNSTLLEFCFQWPALPFTVLLMLVTLYWLMVIVGGLGLDFFDVHVDGDFHVDADVAAGHDFHLDPGVDAVDGHASLTDLGLIGIRWFNLGDVPLMLWVSMLALTAWAVTVTFDRDLAGATNGQLAVVALRNLVIGMLGAKLFTQPLKGKLRHKEPNTIPEMMGRQGVVSSSEVTPQFGQVECPDPKGAPLKLHARTIEGALARGTNVEIVDYLQEERTYIVRERLLS